MIAIAGYKRSAHLIARGIVAGLLVMTGSVSAQTGQNDTSRLENPTLPYTAVAPDLTERVKTMTAEDFAIAMLYRYPIIVGFQASPGDDLKALREKFLEDIKNHERGELNMPTWDRDPNIKPHISDLYAYLTARADGALGPGRPRRIDEK
jgi:hypothetical protein